MIIKDKKNHGKFFQCNNAVMEDLNLSPGAKGVMGYLLSKPPKWKVCKAQLMEALRVGKKALNTLFDELLVSGYAVPNNGSWDIYETPQSRVREEPSDMGAKGALGRVREAPDEGAEGTVQGVQKEPLVRYESKKERVRGEGSKGTPLPPSTSNPEELIDSDLPDDSDENSNQHCSNGQSDLSVAPELIEQAKTILSFHPMPKNAPESIRDIKLAIQEHGYERLMAATKAYAKKCAQGTFRPSWSIFWYKEGSFIEYLPAPEEPFQAREYIRPDYLTPDMEELVLEDMHDVVYAIYKNFNPQYEYDEEDSKHFMETAKLCFYRELVPYSVVRANQGDIRSLRKPSKLHGINAETNSLDVKKGGNPRGYNLAFWQDHYSRETRNYREIVERLRERNTSMSRDEILLDPTVPVPAWYRVVACAPSSPRSQEIIDRWRKHGMCEILSDQAAGLVEALFSVDRIHAYNLFPYYLNRYVKAEKVNGRSSSINALLELAQQSEHHHQREDALAA